MVSINTGGASVPGYAPQLAVSAASTFPARELLAQAWGTMTMVHTEATHKAVVKERDIESGVERVCTIDEPHLERSFE